MIEGLKPYAEYKKSGLTWLYRIPVGWNEQRSKYLSREVDRRSTSGDEMRLSMSQRHGLIPSADSEVEMSIQNWLFRTFGTTGFEQV
jgi:type I restriction enzyme S subunit